MTSSKQVIVSKAMLANYEHASNEKPTSFIAVPDDDSKIAIHPETIDCTMRNAFREFVKSGKGNWPTDKAAFDKFIELDNFKEEMSDIWECRHVVCMPIDPSLLKDDGRCEFVAVMASRNTHDERSAFDDISERYNLWSIWHDRRAEVLEIAAVCEENVDAACSEIDEYLDDFRAEKERRRTAASAKAVPAPQALQRRRTNGRSHCAAPTKNDLIDHIAVALGRIRRS